MEKKRKALIALRKQRWSVKNGLILQEAVSFSQNPTQNRNKENLEIIIQEMYCVFASYF